MSNVNIATINIASWRGPISGVELRLSLDNAIVTPEGDCYGSSPIVVARAACDVNAVVINDLTQYVLTIPAITLPATQNALVGRTARYTATFNKTSNGALIQAWLGFESFSLPAAPDNTTWGVIRVANEAGITQYADQHTFTRAEILSLFEQFLGQIPSLGDYVATTDVNYSRPADVGFIQADATAAPMVINLGLPGAFAVEVRKSPDDATFNTVTINYGAGSEVLNIAGQNVKFVPVSGSWILWTRSF